MRHAARRLCPLLLAASLGLLAGCRGDGGGAPPAPLSWLHATRGADPGVFDAEGRQVLLRGVNFNHLADTWVGDPSLPTVAALGDDDWDDAASHGMNGVRLVTCWSAWAPERDQLDEAYLARVRAAVEAANRLGIYAARAWARCRRVGSPAAGGWRLGVEVGGEYTIDVSEGG